MYNHINPDKVYTFQKYPDFYDNPYLTDLMFLDFAYKHVKSHDIVYKFHHVFMPMHLTVVFLKTNQSCDNLWFSLLKAVFVSIMLLFE